MRPIITLTTDFGLNDPFVGIMKGVILNISPKAKIVDITHNIEPQNIKQTAFVLNATYSWFPRKTIHMVVVDPGVATIKKNIQESSNQTGSLIRRAMVVQSKFQTFVGPDNGVLTPILYNDYKAYEINSKNYILKNISNTFHGRDVFAPCAAWIANGIAPGKMGPRILKPVLQDFPQPKRKESSLQGEIIHIDHFGNLTTNISAELINETFSSSAAIKIQIGKDEVYGLVNGYHQIKKNQLGAILNSCNQLEIFYREDSAKKKLKAKVGQLVFLRVL